uniref:Uncharacterized protein n=1 Tax=Brassica oleracea var. oleracea TaxID=109376 RepID=A0A0D3DWZ4_BRAOL
MLEEHKKRFTFRFTERDSGPSPSTRPTGDNHRFTSSTTTHGERRFRDVDEERDFRRFVYDPRREDFRRFVYNPRRETIPRRRRAMERRIIAVWSRNRRDTENRLLEDER